MRLAINSDPAAFFDLWASYCEEHRIPYRRVDCAADDIIEQMKDCDALIWWWDTKHRPYALQLTRALELSGKRVSPSSNDVWYLDDKVAQKYLFESAGLPAPRTYVFYDRQTALMWAKSAEYPKAFKLRSGFHSKNVWLIRNPSQAARFIRRAFGGGFEVARRAEAVTTRFHRLAIRRTPRALAALIKHLLRFTLLILPRFRADASERGYAYFQNYIPHVRHTYLILVSGKKAYALRQTGLPGEFKVSGNSVLEAGHAENVPKSCVDLAFFAAKKLQCDRLGLEMIIVEGMPIILEIDPFVQMRDFLPGFWDQSLGWHEMPLIPALDVIAEFVKLDGGRPYAASITPRSTVRAEVLSNTSVGNKDDWAEG